MGVRLLRLQVEGLPRRVARAGAGPNAWSTTRHRPKVPKPRWTGHAGWSVRPRWCERGAVEVLEAHAEVDSVIDGPLLIEKR